MIRFVLRKGWKLAVVVVVAVILAGWAAWYFPNQVLTVDSGPVTADVLVVLGGAGPERTQRAAELFKAGAARLIVCSGYGDADANKERLTSDGVPAADILLESKSHSTEENAKFTIAMLRARHVKSVIVVTSWYHSRRSFACFEHFAPDLKIYSRPAYFAYARGEWKRQGISRYIDDEYVKMLGYWVRYGVCPI